MGNFSCNCFVVPGLIVLCMTIDSGLNFLYSNITFGIKFFVKGIETCNSLVFNAPYFFMSFLIVSNLFIVSICLNLYLYKQIKKPQKQVTYDAKALLSDFNATNIVERNSIDHAVKFPVK